MNNSFKPEFNPKLTSHLENPELQRELRELDQKCNHALELLDGSNQEMTNKIEDYRRKQREALFAKYEISSFLI